MAVPHLSRQRLARAGGSEKRPPRVEVPEGMREGTMSEASGGVWADSEGGLSETLREMIGAARGDTVTLREIVDGLGDHGMLAICAVLCLPFVLPVSVPGLSTVVGLAVILLGGATALNRRPWLPSAVLDKRIDGGKLRGALERGADAAGRLDRFVKPRLSSMVRGAFMNWLNGLAIVAGGVLLMWPFGFVPFSNTLPGVAVIVTALGMTQRDGLLVLAGYALLVATAIYFGALLATAAFAGASFIG
jgi:hypothetical protein